MKNFTYLLLFAAAIFMSACTGPQGEKGDKGDPGAPGESTQWKIIDMTINSADWQLDYAGSNYTNPYYYASFNVPELDDFIYDAGLTKCYIEFNKGTSNRAQQELPYVRHFEGYTTEGEQFTWTRTVDYEYGVGFVNIFCTFSDFFVEDKPESMDFRLVLMW